LFCLFSFLFPFSILESSSRMIMTTLSRLYRFVKIQAGKILNIGCLISFAYRSTLPRETDFSLITKTITIRSLYIEGMNLSPQDMSLYFQFCLFLSDFCTLLSKYKVFHDPLASRAVRGMRQN
jgi:hypothetical protein